MSDNKVALPYYKLSFLAELIGAELIGDDIEVNGISSIDFQLSNTVSILSLTSKLKFYDGDAAALIISDDIYKRQQEFNKPILKVRDSRLSVVKMLDLFFPKQAVKQSISSHSIIGDGVDISSPVEIGHFVVIGDDTVIGSNTIIKHNTVIGKSVKIGSNCIIYPNVTVCDDVVIGDNVILHSGAVIGGDGFGFIPTGDLPVRIQQKGNVVLADYVEIGANTCVDRATLGSTVVSRGTKLAALVMVGHNTVIGKSCLVASQAGFSGSMVVGDHVLVAGQAGFSDHINIASNTIFGGQAGVNNDIKEAGMYMGSPCMPMAKYARSFAIFAKLPELLRRVKDLENKSN